MDSNVLILALNEKFKKLSKSVQVQVQTVEKRVGPVGATGAKGLNGPKGPEGPRGTSGSAGALGKVGKKGKDGSDGVSVMDASIAIDNHLVLTLSDGKEIDAGSLKGSSEEPNTIIHSAGGSSEASVKYTAITTATYTILDGDLIEGTNIFGVNFAGAVTITVPSIVDSLKLILVKDESLSAGVNPITVVAAV